MAWDYRAAIANTPLDPSRPDQISMNYNIPIIINVIYASSTTSFPFRKRITIESSFSGGGRTTENRLIARFKFSYVQESTKLNKIESRTTMDDDLNID